MNMNIDQSISNEKTNTASLEHALRTYISQNDAQQRQIEELRSQLYDTSYRVEQMVSSGVRSNSCFFAT